MRTVPSELSERIRKYDNDRYLCSLFAEEKYIKDLHTLYAFNLEISRIRELTNEPVIGMIRLQWWRDAIEEIYQGKPRKHEVIDELKEIIKNKNVDKKMFLGIIDAREKDLDNFPINNISELHDYAQNTSSSLLFIASKILEEDANEIINLVGKIWAITGLLRSIKFHAMQGRVYLPQDSGVDFEKILSLKFFPELEGVIKNLVLELRKMIYEAKGKIKNLDSGKRKKTSANIIKNYII